MHFEKIFVPDNYTGTAQQAFSSVSKQYEDALKHLEAQKQICRQVISMRCSTADISYTGMFDRDSLARHVQNCYAYADWTSTLVEVNYVNENFCLSFTQKFATDRYVKAFRELLEQYGIACTEIEETKFI